MSKIKNRFLPNQFIIVHDELLGSLYELTPRTMQYRIINGEKYIVNSVKLDHCEIGLRVKIEDNTLPSVITDGDYITNYYTNPLNYIMDNVDYAFYGSTLDQYYQYVCFSNMEKYMLNILLDNYLSSNQQLDMTFLQIEHKYRAKASYRSKSLSKKVALRYAKTLDSLCAKELFIITDDKFRDYRYGVRDKAIYQKLLTIKDKYIYGLNNVTFSYTLGGFGILLKQSRRYSTIMPIGYYRIGFNELRWHLMGFYLAKQIFIQQGIINKNPSNSYNWTFKIDLDKMIKLTNEQKKPTELKKPVKNYLRLKRSMVDKIEKYLDQNCGIEDFRVEYSYTETDRFALKHQYDYDIKTDLDNYKFGIKDLDQDVEVEITVVMKTF